MTKTVDSGDIDWECHNRIFALMVELVDTRDLKSLSHCDCTGSTPVWGTNM